MGIKKVIKKNSAKVTNKVLKSDMKVIKKMACVVVVGLEDPELFALQEEGT